jgi:prophage regulatory protein
MMLSLCAIQEATLNTIDPIVSKPDVVRATALSDATIWREQRAGRFPPFDRISSRRVGLRQSRLQEWLDGRRDWHEPERETAVAA